MVLFPVKGGRHVPVYFFEIFEKGGYVIFMKRQGLYFTKKIVNDIIN